MSLKDNSSSGSGGFDIPSSPSKEHPMEMTSKANSSSTCGGGGGGGNAGETRAAAVPKNESEYPEGKKGREDPSTGPPYSFARKITKGPPGTMPDTPEQSKKSTASRLKASVSAPKHPSTMERYLEDQYEHWIQRPPPTTFGLSSSLEQPLIKPRTLPSDLASLVSKPNIEPWTRRVSITHEISDSEDEKGGLMARIIPFGQSSKNARTNARDKRRRIVEKDGDPNIQYKNISKRRRKYISDLYTTLVDTSLLESLLIFAASFYITWLLFALVYYIICYAHGDLEESHLPKNQENSSWTPCVLEIEDFASCFLFSLETQHTIGYGSRQTTNECTSAMIAMSLQSVVGCLIQAFMVGLVFARLTRPQSRSKTVVFSKHAVVCERNRKLCMIFRVGDMRHDSFIVNASISVKVIRRRVTEEGEMYHEVFPIKINPDSADEPCIFLIWPITIIHVIDDESPFYKMNASDLANDKFELHMVLEGVTESTSMTFQARTSYLPHEILWGNRFEPMMLYRRDHNKYQVNFSAFHSTYEVDTPVCSSFELEQYYKTAANYTNPKFGAMRTPPPSAGPRSNTAQQHPWPQVAATSTSSSGESAGEDDSQPTMAHVVNGGSKNATATMQQ